MKPIIPSALRRAAVLLPAFSLLLAPWAAFAAERANPDRRGDQQLEELGTGGRGGIIEEFNFGPTGMDVIKQRPPPTGQGETRLLSGRVVELKGQTLYVERRGVVVPLDVSALRLTQKPKVGQEVIASYQVAQTHNMARSLSGEVGAAK
jgi:hypothetical protein